MSTAAAVPASLAPKVDEELKDYYGKKMNKASDFKSGVCTTPTLKYPKFIRDALSSVHDEVAERYFGCGAVFAPAVTGCHILDLGSGSGRDCFALSKLVGPDGYVTGIDLTDEQLEIARKYIPYHTKLYGYPKANVRYIKGDMEKMQEAGMEANEIDVIISNCVVNLAKDKAAVLRESHRVLKEGGEIYFSDIYTDMQLPDEARADAEMWCECVSGALYWKDLHKLAAEYGFSRPRTVTGHMKNLTLEDYKSVLGQAKFVSVCYSLFKMPAEKSDPKTVTYNGGIEGFEDELMFDYNITFKKGEKSSVGSELATILQTSRYKKYFSFEAGQTGVKKCSNLDLDPFEYFPKNKSNVDTSCSPGGGCC